MSRISGCTAFLLQSIIPLFHDISCFLALLKNKLETKRLQFTHNS